MDIVDRYVLCIIYTYNHIYIYIIYYSIYSIQKRKGALQCMVMHGAAADQTERSQNMEGFAVQQEHLCVVFVLLYKVHFQCYFRELQSFVLQSYDNDSDHVMYTAEKRDLKGKEL